MVEMLSGLLSFGHFGSETEVVRDGPEGRKLQIREHPKQGVYVQNLAELVVKCPEDMAKLIEQGARINLVVAVVRDAAVVADKIAQCVSRGIQWRHGAAPS